MSEHSARFAGVLGEDYDLFGKSVAYHDELQDKIRTHLAEHTSTDGERIKILEAGVGTGITTLRILTANPYIEVYGVDNESKTLNQAKEVLKDFSGRLFLSKEDILEYVQKQPAESFHGFVSAYVLHNLPPDYRERLFPEIARVLKKGAVYINADKLALDDEQEHAQTLEEQLKAFDVYDEMGRPEVKEEWIKHYLEDEIIKFKESEQIALLEQNGFSDVQKIFRERSKDLP